MTTPDEVAQDLEIRLGKAIAALREEADALRFEGYTATAAKLEKLIKELETT